MSGGHQEVKLPSINQKHENQTIQRAVSSQERGSRPNNNYNSIQYEDYSDIKQHLNFQKSERQKVEEEEQALVNRINKLQMQERVIEKQIDETTQKALDIYNIKKREQHQQEELKKKMLQADEIPFTHPKGQLDMLKCQASMEEIQNKKKKDTEELKQKLALQHMRREKEQQLRLQNVRWKADIIKQSKRQVSMIVKYNQEEKRKKVAIEAHEQIMGVEDIIQQKNQKLAELQNEEKTILQRLSNTQLRQKNASETLLASQKLIPQEFQEKFQPTLEVEQSKMSQFNSNGSSITIQMGQNGSTSITPIQN